MNPASQDTARDSSTSQLLELPMVAAVRVGDAEFELPWAGQDCSMEKGSEAQSFAIWRFRWAAASRFPPRPLTTVHT